MTASMLRDCSEAGFIAELVGREVMGVERLGKFLLLPLGGPGGWHLTLHLGMTGQILVTQEPSGGTAPAVGSGGATLVSVDAADVHARFVFVLEDDDGGRVRVVFRDMRKFGRVHLTAGGPAERLGRLGPDAWIGEWDAHYLAELLRRRRAPIKAFLLDQRHLAGIGNIYADESLWWAGIDPTRPCGALSVEEVERLAAEIRRQLSEGVARLGCTLSDFVDTEGRPGGFQEQLQAYGRRGQTCSRCGRTMTRTVVAGRGTTYCPGCQQ